jgi:hypothetical protein
MLTQSEISFASSRDLLDETLASQPAHLVRVKCATPGNEQTEQSLQILTELAGL